MSTVETEYFTFNGNFIIICPTVVKSDLSVNNGNLFILNGKIASILYMGHGMPWEQVHWSLTEFIIQSLLWRSTGLRLLIQESEVY